MIDVDPYMHAIFNPSFEDDTLLFLVLTCYDKNKRPISLQMWRGYSESFPLPELLSDADYVGLIFAKNKPGLFSLFERKKKHPRLMSGENIIGVLDLIKARMKKNPAD